MTEPEDQPADAGLRLYGMMQHLMAAHARGSADEVPDARGVVELQDALDASLQLAAVIDEATQAGRLRRERGKHAASMLMIVRDYVQPLPRGLAADGVTDDLTPDLHEMVAALRAARDQASTAEGRLAARGIELEEEDFGRDDEPDVGGCLLTQPVDDGTRVRAVIRPGMRGWQREMFAEWAESRFDRFMEHGPEPDGWQERSEGGSWQLWSRLQQMPDPGE